MDLESCEKNKVKGPTLQEIRTRTEAGYLPLSEKESAAAEDFIKAYYKNIVEKWMNFFVLKKRARCTQITKKVK